MAIMTIKRLVKAAGNCPVEHLIESFLYKLLGSSARTKAGMPIVSPLTRESCAEQDENTL